VEICQSQHVSKGVGHFEGNEHKYQKEGGITHQLLLVSER